MLDWSVFCEEGEHILHDSVFVESEEGGLFDDSRLNIFNHLNFLNNILNFRHYQLHFLFLLRQHLPKRLLMLQIFRLSLKDQHELFRVIWHIYTFQDTLAFKGLYELDWWESFGHTERKLFRHFDFDLFLFLRQNLFKGGHLVFFCLFTLSFTTSWVLPCWDFKWFSGCWALLPINWRLFTYPFDELYSVFP